MPTQLTISTGDNPVQMTIVDVSPDAGPTHSVEIFPPNSPNSATVTLTRSISFVELPAPPATAEASDDPV